MRPLNVLIWHVHGAYLYYLTQSRHRFYVPSKPDRAGDYAGRCGRIPWGDNVVDVPVDEVKNLDLDCVIYQLPHQYQHERRLVLSREQQRLPQLYIEHDPPLDHPSEQRHVTADDPNLLLVHVTPFNALMWDSGRTPATVIEHGVIEPDVRHEGGLARGLTAVNNIDARGRRVGPDVFRWCRERVPIDLVGMGSEGVPGGLGEVIHEELPAFRSRYRFYFNPTRYTSLNLAVCEAMIAGLPVVGLATTEMARAVPDGIAGYVDNSPERLVDAMRALIADPGLARALGEGARRHARERFGIERFARDWDRALELAAGRRVHA